MPTSTVHFRDLLHAANLRHGTHGFTSLPKEGVLRIFPPLKNPTASAGFLPANLGTRGRLKRYALRRVSNFFNAKARHYIKQRPCFKRLRQDIRIFFTSIFSHDRWILLINAEGNSCEGTFSLDFMPRGIQPDVVSGSVNTQMWDDINSAMAVKFHSHPRVQAPDLAPLKKWRHISERFQFKTFGRLGDGIV
jgi:hypothetical protein